MSKFDELLTESEVKAASEAASVDQKKRAAVELIEEFYKTEVMGSKKLADYGVSAKYADGKLVFRYGAKEPAEITVYIKDNGQISTISIPGGGVIGVNEKVLGLFPPSQKNALRDRIVSLVIEQFGLSGENKAESRSVSTPHSPPDEQK